jgi:hypothetical protein
MTTYHRYLIADGGTATLDELRQCLQDCDPAYEIDGELVTHHGVECGILVDVTHRGDPIFDADVDLLKRRADRDQNVNEVHRGLDGSTCMVTTQITSTCDATALEALWEWLRKNKKGILAYEGGGFRIDL